MTIEDKIQALLAKAEPLRALPEAEQEPLAELVDEINRLRALQASGYVEPAPAVEEGADATGWAPLLDVPSDLVEDIDEMPALREHAAELGVKVDKRWGEDRLRAEIEKAGKA